MIDVLCHSSIKIVDRKTIYVDPFKINQNEHDADYIFFTHSHYDHFSPEDIEKVKKEDTVFIITKDIEHKVNKIISNEKYIVVEPQKAYKLKDLCFKTTYSYNIDKPFHPKENEWVGYIIDMNDKQYYIAGDTDNIEEIQNIKCDIACIPIGGTYTMNYQEAADLANNITAEIIIPTHYGSIVGNKEDAMKFKELVNEKEVKILL